MNNGIGWNQNQMLVAQGGNRILQKASRISHHHVRQFQFGRNVAFPRGVDRVFQRRRLSDDDAVFSILGRLGDFRLLDQEGDGIVPLKADFCGGQIRADTGFLVA